MGYRFAGVTVVAAPTEAESPPGSVAVTVVVPAAIAETVNALPLTETVATEGSELAAT